MYTYDEFVYELKKVLEVKLKESDLKVTIGSIEKNNESNREVVIIHGDGLPVSPSIGLKALYTYYESFEDISLVVDAVMDIISNQISPDIVDVVKTWECVKDKITFKVVNAELNQNRLHDVPSKDYLDLKVICCIKLRDDENSAIIEVKSEMLEFWKITEAELWSAAENNFINEQYEIRDMREVLSEMMQMDCVDGVQSDMYVMTNESKCYGAAGILCANLLEEFAMEHGDFIVLPCSVHELILVKASMLTEVESIKDMIQVINIENVDPEEVLSNNYYYYSKEKRELALM